MKANMQQFRIAASGIVLKENKILLVKYENINGNTVFVGPGGAANIDESLEDALVREVLEETGVNIKVEKILCVEDLLSSKHRLLKLWFLCSYINGNIIKTQDAINEGITEVNWYSQEELKNKITYPNILLTTNWPEFLKDNWQVKYLTLKKAAF